MAKLLGYNKSMNKICKKKWSLYSFALCLLNLMGCGSIPEERQACAIRDSDRECYLFLKQPGKTCVESSYFEDPSITYDIVDIQESSPCYAEL